MGSVIQAEYIWIDGGRPLDEDGKDREYKKLRSKTRIIRDVKVESYLPNWTPKYIEPWGFDGSSTYQATTDKSDVKLVPVRVVPDPIRGGDNLLVLCETLSFNKDGEDVPHPSNTRHRLVQAMKRYEDLEPWVGVEQEYTMMQDRHPYRWPAHAAPLRAQGSYYCGVGYDELYGARLKEKHTRACIEAQLLITGTNAEVMPAQWEFQIGAGDPLTVADHLWLARYLLYTCGIEFGIYVTLDPKPQEGDWNGAGQHTNFSTKMMRQPDGIKQIEKACTRLGEFHGAHMSVYGRDNKRRLTGRHETCRHDQFRFGVGDRGGSIRIPTPVAKAGCGYLEDRRPAASADPYEVSTALLESICGDGFRP